MHDLAGAQEADDVVDVRIVGQTQDVVVRCPCLLLCGHILRKIGDHIAFDRNGRGRPRRAGGKLRIDPGSMIYKVRVKSGFSDLLRRHISRQLIYDCTNHFQVPEFLGADVR